MKIRSASKFQTDASPPLGRLVSAASALVAELGEESPNSADIVRQLGLDRKLGWQLFRIATASDPMLAGAHLFTPASMQRLLLAAERVGIERDIRDRLLAAFEECELLVKRHAVDRASFALMAASTADSVRADIITVADRRAVFKGQSRILGVTALSTFKTFFFHPGDSSSELGDVVSLRGIHELVPTRPQMRWPISWARASKSNSDAPVDDDIFRPLPGCQTTVGLSIAEQFCSHPLPAIEHNTEPDGSIRSDLLLEGVGRTHSTTVVIGYYAKGSLPIQKNTENSSIIVNLDVRVPCERCYLDVFVHRDLPWPNLFHPKVFGDHFSPNASIFGRTRDLLPFHCDITRGSAVRVAEVQPPVQDYQQLVKWTCSNIGWDISEFQATRVIIEYPIMPSTLQLEMPL